MPLVIILVTLPTSKLFNECLKKSALRMIIAYLSLLLLFRSINLFSWGLNYDLSDFLVSS